MTIARRILHLPVLPLIATFASSALADALLQIDGIQGDSPAVGIQNQIPAVQIDLIAGPDARLGPAAVKSVDYATPALVRAAAEKATFHADLITVRRIGLGGDS